MARQAGKWLAKVPIDPYFYDLFMHLRLFETGAIKHMHVTSNIDWRMKSLREGKAAFAQVENTPKEDENKLKFSQIQPVFILLSGFLAMNLVFFFFEKGFTPIKNFMHINNHQ